MKVLVRHSFEIWEDWEDKYATKKHIEFAYNEGSSCSDNRLDSICNFRTKQVEKNQNYCLCPVYEAEVLEIGQDDPTCQDCLGKGIKEYVFNEEHSTTFEMIICRTCGGKGRIK